MRNNINIFVGENGSGKSRLLSRLVTEDLNDGYEAIAIATSHTDKFPKRSQNKPYHYMGGRLGRNVASRAIKYALASSFETGDKLTSNIFKILKFAGFEEDIGISIIGLKRMKDIPIDKQNALKQFGHGAHEFLFSKLDYFYELPGRIIWLDRSPGSTGLSIDTLIFLLMFEKTLRENKMLSNVVFYLRKGNRAISLNEASSGELSLISTSIFIASKIKQNSSIFIDEPENSLHPEWQKKYIRNLLDIFYLYEPKIYIATHSPMIISGAAFESDVIINRFDGNTFTPVKANIESIEDSLIDQFGIVTPQNHALSERCIDIINNVTDSKLSKDEALKRIDHFLESSFDNKQKDFLTGVRDLISELKVN